MNETEKIFKKLELKKKISRKYFINFIGSFDWLKLEIKKFKGFWLGIWFGLKTSKKKKQ